MVRLEERVTFRTRKGKRGMIHYPIKELVVVVDDKPVSYFPAERKEKK